MLVYVIRFCLRRRWQLIHAVEESVFIALVVKFLFGIPYVYDMDSSLPRQLQDSLPALRPFAPFLVYCERLAVRNSQGIVAVCQALVDVATAHSDRVPIVRVEDVSLLTDEARASTQTSSHPPYAQGSVLMYVGNLQPYQGIDLLLESFVHVFHRHDDAHLVIVGGSREEIGRYASRSEKLGIGSRTHFLGPRPIAQLGEYFEQADVLVSPRTVGSNTPMKIFSYLESGKPVLATRLSMHTQVLDEAIAYLVEPTPLEMSRAMSELIRNSQLRTEIARRAQERIRDEYNADLMNSKLSIFFQQLAENLVYAKQ
jgi:glycosyltransferase involved in cell wall biosynthesis